MKKIDGNTIEVTLFGETRKVKFSLGLDSELIDAIGRHLSTTMQGKEDIQGNTEFIEFAKKYAGADNVEDIEAQELLTILNDFSSKTKVSSASILNSICEEHSSYLNLYGTVNSIILTKRDVEGNIIELVKATEIMYGEKYQSEEARKELDEIFVFAQERFNNFIDKRLEDTGKKVNSHQEN